MGSFIPPAVTLICNEFPLGWIIFNTTGSEVSLPPTARLLGEPHSGAGSEVAERGLAPQPSTAAAPLNRTAGAAGRAGGRGWSEQLVSEAVGEAVTVRGTWRSRARASKETGD